MISNHSNIRSQIHGKAKALIPFFENHFKDFDSADQKYMIVIQWKDGLRGRSSTECRFSDDREVIEATYSKYKESKEVLYVYLFEWDLGISLIKDNTVSDFNEAFQEVLKDA